MNGVRSPAASKMQGDKKRQGIGVQGRGLQRRNHQGEGECRFLPLLQFPLPPGGVSFAWYGLCKNEKANLSVPAPYGGNQNAALGIYNLSALALMQRDFAGKRSLPLRQQRPDGSALSGLPKPFTLLLFVLTFSIARLYTKRRCTLLKSTSP